MRIASNRWSAFATVGIPIINDLNGLQSEPTYRLFGGVLVGFDPEHRISLLPGEQLDAALDQLHIQAFPDPKDRPPRMTAGDTVDPRTDYTE